MNIDYIEFATGDISASRAFFEQVFKWKFTDYGPEYTSFSRQGVDGGFFASEHVCKAEEGAPLVVLKHDDLPALLEQVERAGGHISKPIFSFPGGQRFHFIEPGGNELAVWSE